MDEEIAWIDKNYNALRMDEISDIYLRNIIRYIGKGGGHADFVTLEKVIDLINEAAKRRLI